MHLNCTFLDKPSDGPLLLEPQEKTVVNDSEEHNGTVIKTQV